MKKIIRSGITFLIAIVGAVGGFIWTFFYNGGIESVILMLISILEIIGFLFLKDDEDNQPFSVTPKNEQNVNLHLSIGEPQKKENSSKTSDHIAIDRNSIVNSMKSKSRILFIDDDKNFNIVKILKDSGWKNTKTVIDVKSIDVPVISEADIIFVDINGVGKLLELQHQGLDLAFMIKGKYSNKKVGIYSANPNSNSFHSAWDVIDFKLEKNALPLQFQSIVEKYSIELYNK
jgi:hypothetical protein